MKNKVSRGGKPILAAALLALAAGAAEAQPRDWARLGSKQVSDAAERDVIRVAGQRRYAQIRLCASRRAVVLYDVDVVFANGGAQDVRVRRQLRAGGCTRAIDLAGARRDIRRIVLKYETRRDRGPQGVITAFAR